jgi:hypothetical protein
MRFATRAVFAAVAGSWLAFARLPATAQGLPSVDKAQGVVEDKAQDGVKEQMPGAAAPSVPGTPPVPGGGSVPGVPGTPNVPSVPGR